MRLVIADTSPIRYLVHIGQIELLPQLFGKILLPSVVAGELRHPSAPAVVRAWIERPPAWVETLAAPDINDPALRTLDPGERSAIALGLSLEADLILIDDRKGADAARLKGFEVTGVLGVLDIAASRGLVLLREALDRLTRTNFRYRRELLDAMLKRHHSR